MKRIEAWIGVNEAGIETVPRDAAGVYRVYAQNPIARLRGKDSRGLLLVGESNYLRSRLMGFIYAVSGKKESHRGGERFHQLHLSRQFPIARLRIRYTTTGSGKAGKAAARSLQDKELIRYQDKFGELPPLNNNGGVSWKNRPLRKSG